MTTGTNPTWRPPTTDGATYWWTISFHCRGEYWSPQSELLGGPPDDVDLEQLLHDWCQGRSHPAATWRLQVARGDEVLASVERWFDARAPQVTRWHPNRGVYAPPCWSEQEHPHLLGRGG